MGITEHIDLPPLDETRSVAGERRPGSTRCTRCASSALTPPGVPLRNRDGRTFDIPTMGAPAHTKDERILRAAPYLEYGAGRSASAHDRPCSFHGDNRRFCAGSPTGREGPGKSRWLGYHRR